MTKQLKYGVITLAVMATLLLANAPPAHSVYSSPVSVINQPSVSLAQGSVVGIAPGGMLGIDPANNTVQVSSLPPVQLVSGASVTLAGNSANNPLLVRDIDNPARRAVALDCRQYPIPDGKNGASCRFGLVNFSNNPNQFLVPAGKRLVIDHVSASVELISGAVTQVTVAGRIFISQSASIGEEVNLTAVPLGTNHFATSQLLQMTIDQGSAVTLSVSRDTSNGFGQFDAQILGHLIDCNNNCVLSDGSTI